VDPASVDFGTVWTGDGSDEWVWVYNEGAAACAGLTVSAPDDARFTVSDTCSGHVEAHGSCSIKYRFSPTGGGAASATGTVVTPTGTIPITLQGTGRATTVSASPVSLDFGQVAVGSTATLTSTLTNGGSEPLTGFAGGGLSAPFQVSQDCVVAGGIAVGASCHYYFDFSPTEIGEVGATSYTSTSLGPVIIEVHGTGIAP
jgi:hypothetical protein